MYAPVGAKFLASKGQEKTSRTSRATILSGSRLQTSSSLAVKKCGVALHGALKTLKRRLHRTIIGRFGCFALLNAFNYFDSHVPRTYAMSGPATTEFLCSWPGVQDW